MTKSIFIFTPSFGVHGGIRIILEWANRLSKKHTVFLHSLSGGTCDWFTIDPAVKVVDNMEVFPCCDLAIITSPHSIRFANAPSPARKVIFLQMMEHHFRPNDKAWVEMCMQTYRSPLPILSIAQWNIDEMRRLGRTGPTYLIGNGVNTEHFPLSHVPKSGRIVLVEGWTAGNPTKDSLQFGPKVAEQLKRDGFRIHAYGSLPLRPEHCHVVDKFIRCPSLEEMNQLYEEATIMIKATKLDARSCAPMEAMTKGTVTARAILLGDDDLIDGHNCLRCSYNNTELLQNARKLLNDVALRERLARNCYFHVVGLWDRCMQDIERLLWMDHN